MTNHLNFLRDMVKLWERRRNFACIGLLLALILSALLSILILSCVSQLFVFSLLFSALLCGVTLWNIHRCSRKVVMYNDEISEELLTRAWKFQDICTSSPRAVVLGSYFCMVTSKKGNLTANEVGNNY